MSRFLSSFKRLSRKVSLLEKEHLSGELGPSLARYAATGELPEQAWLRDKVLWHRNMADLMDSTIPFCAAMPPEPPPIPQQDIGETVKAGTLVHGSKERGV
jgi:hypothetical protein